MKSLVKAGTWLLVAVAPVASLPASAQETGEISAPATDAPARGTSTQPETARAPIWTIAASAGISNRDDEPDGTWQALALTRKIGLGYVRGALMRYHGTLLQADTALPSDYLVGTLAAGGNFAGWVTDGWISYGRQDYGQISTSQGSRPSTGATRSPYYALGGDFGKVLPLGGGWYLTPTVAGSYAHGKLLRPAPPDTGFTDLETDEPTWSANAALRIDHAFGPGRRHYSGLSISRNWTSNAVSAIRASGFDGSNSGTQPASLDSMHYADGWFEVGATANMELTARLHLDVYATRGFGMLAGNTMSSGISLRTSF